MWDLIASRLKNHGTTYTCVEKGRRAVRKCRILVSEGRPCRSVVSHEGRINRSDHRRRIGRVTTRIEQVKYVNSRRAQINSVSAFRFYSKILLSRVIRNLGRPRSREIELRGQSRSTRTIIIIKNFFSEDKNIKELSSYSYTLYRACLINSVFYPWNVEFRIFEINYIMLFTLVFLILI